MTSATYQVTEMTVAELAIGGMTCASCAARIERKLNRRSWWATACGCAAGGQGKFAEAN